MISDYASLYYLPTDDDGRPQSKGGDGGGGLNFRNPEHKQISSPGRSLTPFALALHIRIQ